MFQRISLSQSLTHYIHSSLSARPWQQHKLAQRGSLGKAFDQVCVCVLCQRVRGDFVHLCIPGHLSVCVYVSEERLFSAPVMEEWNECTQIRLTVSVWINAASLVVFARTYCMCRHVLYLWHVIACIVAILYFPFISAWGLWFVSVTSHQTCIHAVFQRWSVNKPIVKRLILKQPSTQFRLWSSEVFIIVITGAACKHVHAPLSTNRTLLGTEQLLWRNLEFDALLSMFVF